MTPLGLRKGKEHGLGSTLLHAIVRAYGVTLEQLVVAQVVFQAKFKPLFVLLSLLMQLSHWGY